VAAKGLWIRGCEDSAEGLVQRGLAQLGLGEGDLTRLPRGERRKALIGLAIKRTTTVPLEWIAQRLEMGTRSTVSGGLAAMTRLITSDEAWRMKYDFLEGPPGGVQEVRGQ
jgi:hypothetical protein